MYTLKLRMQGTRSKEAWATMSNLFNCNFEEEPDYMEHSKLMTCFRYNRHFWRTCRGILEVCQHPAYVSHICRESKVHIMKLACMRILRVRQWLSSISEEIAKGINLVHLVRDPRAVWSSRRNLGCCKRTFGCSDVEALCRQMREDLDNFASLERSFPGRAVRARHDDIASDPFHQSRDLSARLRLNFSEHVSRFEESASADEHPGSVLDMARLNEDGFRLDA
ncbi:unnamed protein product [Ixodes hexagonus]